MKILLVDDNAKMRAIIRKTIARHLAAAEEIHECEDGNEAIALYSAISPDWVIMDIKLKTSDGLTATQKIVDADPAAKIIIVTQYDDQLYREAASKAGARDYVLKENLLEIPRIMAGPIAE